MKRMKSISSLITVISLFFGVIWLSPVFAAMPTFTSLGQITAEALQAPGAMDMDADGNLYVADARGGEVFKFDPYGKLVQSFDVAGSGRGLAVTADGQRLYVSRDESLVVVDTVSGSVFGSLTGSEVDGPEFMTAGEIDLDADGNLFVVDSGRMAVKVFDVTGQYRNRFGALGPNPGEFMQIGGMTVNPAGQIVSLLTPPLGMPRSTFFPSMRILRLSV